jgi:hypothetical protein
VSRVVEVVLGGSEGVERRVGFPPAAVRDVSIVFLAAETAAGNGAVEFGVLDVREYLERPSSS